MSVTLADAADIRVRYQQRRRERPSRRAIDAYDPWLRRLFSAYITYDFAEHQRELWAWVDAIQPGVRPRPFVGIWPRGGTKSTSAELATVRVGARGVRSYGLYVSDTQEQADRHVETIAAMLESEALSGEHPALAARKISKYGHSRGWRRSRLRTASGFTVDAIGLDTAARGIKVEEERPDWIIIDDIDRESDTSDATEKKIRRLVTSILPAGADDVAVLAIQNLVLPDGVFARLGNVAQERADFLSDRIVSGPHPAIRDLAYTQHDDGTVTITGGTPIWEGQDRAVCEDQIRTWGLTAFLAEAQHETRQRGAKHFLADWWDDRNRYHYDDPTLAAQTESRYMFWDTAEETKTTSAFTACVVLDMVPYRGNYAALVRDVWRARVAIPDVLRVIEERARWWNTPVYRNAMAMELLHDIVVEYASSGKGAVQTLARTAEPWLAERIRGATPHGSKDARNVEAAMPCRAGRVWLPYPHPDCPWLTMFLDELLAVPQSTYRDMTDAFSMGCDWLEHMLSEPGAGYGTQEAA